MGAELILGGKKSGKCRRAELQARIARHQADRAVRVPGLQTVEEPLHLAETVTARSTPGTLLVGKKICLGVVPLGRAVRAFVDALGLLNQRMAACCARVTLMAAGLPLVLKEDTA